MFFKNIFILIGKEFQRLKHNPAALMAVGLLVLMSILVNIETKSQLKITQINTRSPCQVVFSEDSKLIAHLKRNKNPNIPIQFIKSPASITPNSQIQYAKNINCAVEISINDKKTKMVYVVFRSNSSDQTKLHGFSRWLFSSMTAFYSGLNIKQSIQPFKFKKAEKSDTGFNLKDAKSKSMVSAMLIFSAQFFICVALFISLTASEKEKGVLQALSLTTANPNQILLAKIIFHLILSMVASYLMIGILKSKWIFMPTAWWILSPILILSSLSLIAVASIIVSFNKTQSSASLVGFCYLMLVGVVFALAQNFAGFAMVKQLMFENHVISNFGLLFDDTSLTKKQSYLMGIEYLIHTASLLAITPVLLTMSSIIWKKIGCKTR